LAEKEVHRGAGRKKSVSRRVYGGDDLLKGPKTNKPRPKGKGGYASLEVLSVRGQDPQDPNLKRVKLRELDGTFRKECGHPSSSKS